LLDAIASTSSRDHVLERVTPKSSLPRNTSDAANQTEAKMNHPAYTGLAINEAEHQTRKHAEHTGSPLVVYCRVRQTWSEPRAVDHGRRTGHNIASWAGPGSSLYDRPLAEPASEATFLYVGVDRNQMSTCLDNRAREPPGSSDAVMELVHTPWGCPESETVD
jgi:hypothetical protein